MPSYINTNIASLNAQRNLNASQSSLATSLQRLSSGLRINSAKDDAAGMAIATRFTSQINGTDQAIRNANDGISLAQTAEGALGEITNNLQRIRELALQASNSTNSASDRAALDQEVQQRLAEIDRNASQTNFNGQKILDGSFGTANFQVGANAGETIGISLGASASMRTNSIGAVAASTTSHAIGATATGGSVTTAAITAGDFSKTTTSAVDESITLTPLSTVFGKSTDATSTIDASSFAGYDFSKTAVNGGLGANTGSTIKAVGDASLDMSTTSGNFSVDGHAISLTGDYKVDTTHDHLASDIQSQLNAAAGTGAYTVTIDNTTGAMKIQNNSSATAVAITGADATATAAGITNSAGTAGQVPTAQTFSIGGHSITLNSNIADASSLASTIQTKLQAVDANYTATYDSTTKKITIDDAGQSSASAVAITGTSAFTNGVGNIDTAGTAGSSTAAASFTLDGKTVTLNNVSGTSQLVSAIQSGMGASYTVASTSNGGIKVSKNGANGGTLAITSADAQASGSGFAVGAGTTDVGSAGTTDSSLSMTVDGKAIKLTGNDSTLASVATDLQNNLNAVGAFGAGAYSVSVSGSGLKITNNTAGSAAVAITGTDANAQAKGFANLTGTAGATSGSVTLSDFSITGSSGVAVNLSGSYASADDLAAEINKRVSGVYATTDNGKLSLTSSSALTLSGNDATALGFASDTVAANAGSLSSANVKTTDAALSTVQRVDSALSSVSSLRSQFGAIQNRFDSVISNLSSSSENLTASRSRIQDTDFAAETASLTRGQILQQAGTAMLAQANSLPNGVLSLLR